MRGNERDEFTEFRNVATKLVVPIDVTDLKIEPIYEQLEGWHCDLTDLENFESAPAPLKNYVDYLEAQLNVPIRVISVGPDRKQTLQN